MKVISVGFLSPGDKPLVWRGPMLHSIIKQFLGQVEWGQLDYLIIDLPPGTGDVVISLVQTVPLTGAVVVTTPSDVSLQDARKAIEMFKQVKVDIIGIVENMSYFVCPHCHDGDRHLLQGRRPTHRAAVQRSVPRLHRTRSRHPQGGDSGHPIVMEGDQSPHAKSLFAFTHKVIERTRELQAADGGSVIEIR
jgi:ATP-binding protein involved in chromosome partitioning